MTVTEFKQIKVEEPFTFSWPDQNEQYERCVHYHVEGHGTIRIATGWREAFGRERRRILVFRNRVKVLVEFVGADDWSSTRNVIWPMKQVGGRRDVGANDQIPEGFSGFDIAPATSWVTGPYARRGLAIRVHEDDLASMIRVALIREEHKDSAASRRPRERPSQTATSTSRSPTPAPEDVDVGAIRARLLEVGDGIERRELFPTMVPEAAELICADPFAFALSTALDRGTLADIIWTIPYDLKNHLGHLDPARIAEMSEEELSAAIRSLKRKPRYLEAAARTTRELAQVVVNDFGGDAAGIWRGRLASEVNHTFASIHGVGPGIASMAVLLLERGYGIRFDDVDRPAMDIKPDVHTVRVLHRLGLSDEATESAAIRAAREVHPEYPGDLDAPLWKIGREWCKARVPDCAACPMDGGCPRVGV